MTDYPIKKNLKKITELEANQIHQNLHMNRPESELHVVVTANATRLKWPGRTSFTCMYNEWRSF